MKNEFAFQLIDVRKQLPNGREILKGISLSFFHGAKIGVLGLNGSGKSTLLKIMAGVDKEFTGRAIPDASFKIGYLPQEPRLDPDKSVIENIREGVAHLQALLDEFDEVGAKFAEPMTDDEMNELMERQGELQDQIDAADAWDLDRHVGVAMHALRVPPEDADVSSLSGGEIRRVALARLLLSQPDMLLLDEPTNHLDADSVAWLEKYLDEYPGTVVAITHDRYFLDNVAGWILEIDRGNGYPYEGNYSTWLEKKQKRLEQDEKVASSRQRFLERELAWVRKSPKARRAKSKARVSAYEELSQQQGPDKVDQTTIYVPPGKRLGNLVVEGKGLNKGFGDRLLIDGLDFDLPRGGIVGIIGANGAGKTTFFKMIAGVEQPDSGELRFGDTVDISYVDQSRGDLDPDKTVWEQISGGYDMIRLNHLEVSSRAYCSWFNLRGDIQQKKVGVLSGGERNRVQLAMVVKAGGNLLLLDEPTNDLDVDTLRALEEAILGFTGCVMVISHDRWFLDRIATHILAFEGDSQVVWFEGNFEAYEEDRRRRLGAKADKLGRVRYRRLSV